MKFKVLFQYVCCFIGVMAMDHSTTIAQLQPAKADSFLNFIQANKNRSSIFITRNDTTIAHLNEDKIMPLASTVKIMVAIEFAKQASAGTVDEESYVSLKDLEKYYLPGTDGGAHPAWLNFEKSKNHIQKDSIQLLEVARGMIMFSSNANTEYLMDLLGFDNIKNNCHLFDLKYHTAIYPLVSSLFLYQNPTKVSEAKVLKAIRNLSEEDYCKYTFAIHNQLKYDSIYKTKFRPQDLTPNMQKLWSDRLPASTTKEYVRLVKILNNRQFLDNNAYGIIAAVMEFPMENKGFQAAFKRYGVKGGSTSFVLTHVIYLTTQKDVKMELTIFFNNLAPAEEKQLEQWLDPFEAQVIFDNQFKEKLKF